MRVALVVLFAFAGSHGSSCDCGHMGSGARAGNLGHVGNTGHAGFSVTRMPSASIGRVSGTVLAPMGRTSHPHPTFLRGLAVGLRHALVAGADVIESVLGLAPDADAPSADATSPPEPSCASVDDCGEGQLGQGAVCDRWSTAPRSLGVCREACRDDADCLAPLHCRHGLDPDGPAWGGCAE